MFKHRNLKKKESCKLFVGVYVLMWFQMIINENEMNSITITH